MRKAALSLSVLLFATAYAGGPARALFMGSGLLTDANDVKSELALGVAKYDDPGGAVYRGSVLWTYGSLADWSRTELVMKSDVDSKPLDVKVSIDGKHIKMSGPATIWQRQHGKWTSTQGTWALDFEDRRERFGTGEPDAFSFTFTPSTGAPPVSYSGLVANGDIRVVLLPSGPPP